MVTENKIDPRQGYSSPSKHEMQALTAMQHSVQNFEDSPRPQQPPTLPSNKNKQSVHSQEEVLASAKKPGVIGLHQCFSANYERKDIDLERVRRSIVTLPLSNTKKQTNLALRSNSFQLKDSKPPSSKSIANFARIVSPQNEASSSMINLPVNTDKKWAKTPKLSNLNTLKSRKNVSSYSV